MFVQIRAIQSLLFADDATIIGLADDPMAAALYAVGTDSLAKAIDEASKAIEYIQTIAR